MDESTFFNYVAEGNVPTVENTTDTQAIIIVSSPVVESTSVIFSPSIENHGFDSNGYVVHDNDPNNTYLNDCPLCGVVSAEATHRTVSNSGCDAAYDSVGNARDNLVDNISNASSPVFDTDSGLYDSDILNLSDVSVPQRKRPSRSSMVSSVSNKRQVISNGCTVARSVNSNLSNGLESLLSWGGLLLHRQVPNLTPCRQKIIFLKLLKSKGLYGIILVIVMLK